MDVAEIRRKAKNARTPGSEDMPVLHRLPFVQGAPVAKPSSSPSPPSIPGEMPANPLDDFFITPEERFACAESDASTVAEQTTQEEESSRQYLTFTLGSEEYALDIEDIREIIKLREITDIPRVPDFILGIISLRGIIIPVFDLKRRLRLGMVEVTPLSRIIVCQIEDRIVGLLVDSITQVVRLPAGRIEPPPSVLSGLDRDLVEGVGRHQERMMILLNLPCVMNAELI